MSGIESDIRGTGARVVLVHGSLATGPVEWEAQRPLVDEGYQLVVPTRRAYLPHSDSVGEDFNAVLLSLWRRTAADRE